jgi:hypothetical protein
MFYLPALRTAAFPIPWKVTAEVFVTLLLQPTLKKEAWRQTLQTNCADLSLEPVTFLQGVAKFFPKVQTVSTEI